MRLCDWRDISSDFAHLTASIRNGKDSAEPFTFLGISSSAEDQRTLASRWVLKTYPPSRQPLWRGDIYRHDKIRIGYVSADFREHPIGYLTVGMFEHHDKSKFDITAISIGPNDNSPTRRRIESAFETFIDASSLNDGDVAARIRAAEIDVLVDLTGFTTSSRTNIFARRPAPIQVNYLGYPGTMGADYFDYVIADQVIIPPSQQKDYAEKVVYLPDTYQSNDDARVISDRSFSRDVLGIPADAFVFCCFNNNYKITPDVFARWMRILASVPGSVLWLFQTNEFAAANLKKEAEQRGIAAERVIFAKHLPLADHLARQRLADLFLDTLPYNAHTTTSDALWAGLPVLTVIGDTFAGRVAASLLNAVRLPELIVETPEDYERMAIDLALHPEKLAAIRQKLADNRLTTPLFDTALFTRHIEAAYVAMHERHQAGLVPDHILIPSGV
jgi:predicted O-linked N-acetylglucosamine transferase (SPINDLY family)